MTAKARRPSEAAPRPEALGLERPGRTFLRLAGASLAAVGAGALVLFATLSLAMPMGAAASTVTLPAAAFVLLAVTLNAAQSVLRTASLYRTASKRAKGEEAPPPSPAALRDALLTPRRATATLLVAWGIAALVLSLASEEVWLLLAPSFLGAACIAVLPLRLATRRIIRPWIAAFPPTEVAPIPGRGPTVTGLLTASTVLGVGAIATAVGAGPIATRGIAVALGLSLAFALAAVAALIASRMARGLPLEVRRLQRRLERKLEDHGNVDGAVVALAQTLEGAEDPTPIIARLTRAIDDLVASIDKSAASEQHALSSIEEKQRAKVIFMASMSHDLRSPLNSILGFSELLSQGIGGTLTPGQRESVSVIQRSGSELLELLNDIIDSARLDAARLPLRREWTPTVELLTDAIQKGREMVALRTGTGAGFTIDEELQPGLPPVYVDSQRIVQALMCIFRHATRVMEGGAIHLSARALAGGVRVTVRDGGASVQDDDRARVFEAFRALTSSSGRRIGGMGLSLSLARSLLRAHGGDVYYDASAAPGTTFHMSIPRGEPDDTERRGRTPLRGGNA